MRNLTIAFAGLFFAAMPAFAADPGGTVTGTIDGEEVELSVFSQQSDYGNSHISLYIIGDALGGRGLGAMSLGAEWMGNLDGNFSHVEVSTRIHENPLRMYYGDDDDGLTLTLTNSAIAGDLLEISGRVQGTLTQMDRIGHKNPDPDDTFSIDLSFDAVLE
ncbi:hypothetical protein [Pseudosulfitobacter pseudonitzschiae]|uniref:hypothetical protein n=1 Tax=Pseudosulfitobacter pseudonitzschiae TaxID=1402135 RepID=UPI003B7CE13A